MRTVGRFDRAVDARRRRALAGVSITAHPTRLDQQQTIFRLSMSAATVRTILPLALVTCTSMLAMDFYLPAVPSLQRAFDIDVSVAQATIAVFLAALASSQLAWAEIMARFGPRHSVRLGVWLLVVSSVGAAIAPSIEVLIVLRAIQGFAAGSATVVAPSVVRATLADADAVRGLAAIAMVEAIVPAAGPVLGAALLRYTDWRATLWTIAVMTLAVIPFALPYPAHEFSR